MEDKVKKFKEKWQKIWPDVFKITALLAGLAVIGLLGFGVFSFVNNLPMGFAFQIIVLALMVFLLYYLYYKYAKTDVFYDITEKSRKDKKRMMRLQRIVLLVYSAYAMFTLNNYFNPPAEIFTNSDHHALALNGIRVNNPQGFVIAGNSNNAFIDDNSLKGRVVVESLNTDDSTATLSFDGYGGCLYMIDKAIKKNSLLKKDDDIDTYFLVNDKNRPIFYSHDSVEFFNSKGDKVAAFRMIREYVKKDTTKCISRKIYKICYTLSYYKNDMSSNSKKYITDTSWMRKEIQKSYPFASMFPNAVSEGIPIGGMGLSRTRSFVETVVKNREVFDNYSQVGWTITADNTATINKVRINGKYYSLLSTNNSVKVRLDNRPYCLSLDNRMPVFRLSLGEDNQLLLMYRLPHYRYLNAENTGDFDTVRQSQFMVASTVYDRNGELNSSIPDNLLLFDEFDHKDNGYHMEPFLLSFTPGRSNDTLWVDFWDRNAGHERTVKGLCAGSFFPTVHTRNGRAEWLLSIDDFKNPDLIRPKGVSTPHSDKRMMLLLALMAVLSYSLLALSKQRYFSPFETITYMVILTMVEIRLFLMWRVSVFPPVSSISFGEFNQCRNGGTATKWLEYFIGLFFIVVTVSKLWLRGLPGWLRRLLGWLRRLLGSVKKKMTDILGKIDPKGLLKKKKKKIMRKLKRIKMGLIAIKDRIIKSCPKVVRKLLTETAELWRRLWQGNKKIINWVLFVYIPLGLLCYIVNRAFFNVTAPVLYYFIVDFLIYYKLAGRYRDIVEQKEKENYSHFWYALFNSLMASAVLFVLDGGYGIIFFFFSLVASMVRLSYLRGCNPFDKNDYPDGIRWWVVVYFVIGALTSGVLFFSKPLALHLLPGYTKTPIVVAAIVAVLCLVMTLTFQSFRFHRICRVVFCVVILAFASGGGTWFFQHKVVPGSHIENRLLVHQEKPSELLGHQTSKRDMHKFMEASLNDWVMQEYQQRGRSVRGFLGENGNGYLKLQPHSKIGVSWMTQLTDMSVSRLVIAEHSGWMPVMIIIVYLAMLFVGMLMPSDRRWVKSLMVQIPLLLAVQSLIVWMAVTQRFIFVGQDFPLLSILSRANVALVFVLMSAWVIVAIVDRYWLLNEIDDKNERQKESGFKNRELVYLKNVLSHKSKMSVFSRVNAIIFAVFLVLAIVLILIYGRFRKENYYGENGRYGVDLCMTHLDDYFVKNNSGNSLNSLFIDFQEEALANSKTKSRYISSVFPTYKECVKSFCENRKSDIKQFFESIKYEDYGVFAKSVFDNYINSDINENSLEQLLYVVKYRYVDTNNLTYVRYRFGMSNNLFNLTMPRRMSECNRSSIYMYGASDDLPLSDKSANMVVYSIPSEWTRNNERIILLRPINDNMCLQSSTGILDIPAGSVCQVKSFEIVIYNNKAVDLIKYGVGNYLARRVFINGKVEYLYPLKDKFFWARPFANSVKNRSAKDGAGGEDIITTFDRNMMESIGNTINRSKHNMAVIVADGDGRVRAMNERKAGKYRVDPNDSRRIREIEDSLRYEGTLNWGTAAERYFGHLALSFLGNGPGSSQKPIVWTAVTSQFNDTEVLDWNNLMMAPVGQLEKSGTETNPYRYVRAQKYTGVAFPPDNSKKQTYFKSISSDEGIGYPDPVDVRYYMRHSSNFYNSIMVQMGSYTRGQLSVGIANNKALFTPRLNTDISNAKVFREGFPFLQYYNAEYGVSRTFVFSHPLTNEEIENEESLLLRGLVYNFKLPISRNRKVQPPLSKYLLTDRSTDYYAVPALSYFANKKRVHNDDGLRVRDAVKYTAIGSNRVWVVSPLKMAEMFGKLVSLRKNYSLTVDQARKKKEPEYFTVDGTLTDYLKMRNRGFIPGISDVFTAKEGTANGVYNELKEDLEAAGLYVYGKTGTIDNGGEGEDYEEDHLLAVIITNAKLEEIEDEAALKKIKFYVVYIADFSVRNKAWVSIDAKVVKDVINSDVFKKYMNGGDND